MKIIILTIGLISVASANVNFQCERFEENSNVISKICNNFWLNLTLEDHTLNNLESDENRLEVDSLYLYNSILEVLPAQLFEIFPKLDLLSIINSDLVNSTINDDLLENMGTITNLNFQINRLIGVAEGAFKRNVNLTVLNLSFNEIVSLPETVFQHNQKLEHINLNHNSLVSLSPDLFKNNRELKGVYLRNNQLKKIHVDLFGTLSDLRYLFISHNQLETVPINIFKNNEKLTWIDLDQNQIKFLAPMTFWKLERLWKLFLAGNKCVNKHFILKNVFARTNLNLGRCYDNWYTMLYN